MSRNSRIGQKVRWRMSKKDDWKSAAIVAEKQCIFQRSFLLSSFRHKEIIDAYTAFDGVQVSSNKNAFSA